MNQKVTMKEIPSADRPYEKCEKLGAGALSDTELLAVLLRTGTRGENALELASRILYHNGEAEFSVFISSVLSVEENSRCRTRESSPAILYLRACEETFQSLCRGIIKF